VLAGKGTFNTGRNVRYNDDKMATRLAHDKKEPLVSSGASRTEKETLTVRSRYDTVTNRHAMSSAARP
jgi:hypothetical protein